MGPTLCSNHKIGSRAGDTSTFIKTAVAQVSRAAKLL